ncbi:MAG: ribosome maturation factor RimP [Burkholderiaceae bacterium]
MTQKQTLQQLVEQTVASFGYELLVLERSAGGVLRVTMDWPWQPGQVSVQTINVEDCEKVTRQLQFALDVDDTDYRRLEVSSPGIDRPLRSEQDFERFLGEEIDITLKAPMGAQAAGMVSGLRKKFRGRLERGTGDVSWQISWSNAPEPKPGRKVSVKKAPPLMNVLGFNRADLQEARLAPLVDFKGKKPKAIPGAGMVQSPEGGGKPSDELIE